MPHARVEWALPSLCDWSSVTKRGTRASLPLLEGYIDSATEVDTLSAVDANRQFRSQLVNERNRDLSPVIVQQLVSRVQRATVAAASCFAGESASKTPTMTPTRTTSGHYTRPTASHAVTRRTA